MFSVGSLIIENMLRVVVIVLIAWQFGFLNHSDNRPCFHSKKDLLTEKNWMLGLHVTQLVFLMIFGFWRSRLKSLGYYVEQLYHYNYELANKLRESSREREFYIALNGKYYDQGNIYDQRDSLAKGLRF